MLRFSKKVDYGLLALDYLFTQPARKISSAKEIAEKYQIPLELLGKILQRLKKRGLIVSYQGVHGGYVLAKTPDQIALLDVVTAIEGPMGLVDCFNARRVLFANQKEEHGCGQFERCSIRNPIGRVQRKVLELLRSTTVAEISNVQSGVHS